MIDWLRLYCRVIEPIRDKAFYSKTQWKFIDPPAINPCAVAPETGPWTDRITAGSNHPAAAPLANLGDLLFISLSTFKNVGVSEMSHLIKPKTE